MLPLKPFESKIVLCDYHEGCLAYTILILFLAMEDPMKPKLSLVIPCYNEAAGLPKLVDRCAEVLSSSELEILFVNNGSTDESAELLDRLTAPHSNFRVVTVKENKGYGFGILSGLEAARGEYIGWTHADLQTDPNDAVRALEIIEKESVPCFVKGRRYGRPLGDRFFTFGMTVFELIVLRHWLMDINAQPTIFPKSFFDSWKNAPHDFSLDLFAFYQAKQAKLKTIRFPVYFGEREFGTSHWNIDWRSKFKFIKRTMDFTFKLRKTLAV